MLSHYKVYNLAHCFKAYYIVLKFEFLKLDFCASRVWSQEQGETIHKNIGGQGADVESLLVTHQQTSKSFSVFLWQLWHKNKNNLIAANLC